MRDKANIEALLDLKPDFMGLIFYEKSPRYVSEPVKVLSEEVKKVGVFVNASPEEIQEIALKYQLEYLQLHSKETPEMCKVLKEKGFKILKAFSVDNNFDFAEVEPYKNVVDYYLFDTKSPDYGGTGLSFDWKILKNYKGQVPFFIAGGISNENINELLEFKHSAWEGIDLNSKYEISPGLKDIDALKMLFDKVKEIRK